MRNIVNKIYYFIKTREFIIVSTVVTITAGIYAFFPQRESPELDVKNSPGSINTVNQSGGNNTLINNPPLPTPSVIYKLISVNVPYENQYRSIFSARIISNLPIPPTTKMYLSPLCSRESQGGGPGIGGGGSIFFHIDYIIACVTPIETNEKDLTTKAFYLK